MSEKLSEEQKKLTEISAQNIRETRRAEELVYKASEAQKELNDAEEKLKVKFDSLKGFEEQLLVKEGLLNRREQTLDLKEKGVKI